MMNAYTLSEIAEWLGGEVRGDNGVRLNQVASLQHATASQITFLTDSRYLPMLPQTKAGAILIAQEHADATNMPRIIISNPYVAFAKVSTKFNPEHDTVIGIAESAIIEQGVILGNGVSVGAHSVISSGAMLGENVFIGPGCYIGQDVKIDDGSRLNANVVVYHGSQIGKSCTLHSGVVIGADGFGYADDGGQWVKIPQIGKVLIGDNVDIGANTTIDRGALDNTVIEEGVKIDNLVQIGHNCQIGAYTIIAGCTGIAGSARIGTHCRIGGAAMVLGHLEIASRVTISPGSMITRSIKKTGTYTALMPFQEHDAWLKTAAQIRRLDILTERIAELEKEIKSMKGSKA